MFEKILVPVDGSQASMNAVDLASDLAQKFNSEIILLHVLLRGHMPEGLRRAIEVEVGGSPSGELPSHLVNLPQEIMARVGDKRLTQLSVKELEFIGKHLLSKAMQACRDKGLGKVSERVEEGYAADVILEVAKHSKADMIVIGSRGLGRLGDLLLGSVSNKVLHLATCPCTVVK
jgi:nucleotide-binding universal stress UspA family protein